jgi:isoquinoline 1-oxidoreductase beta subunit
VLTYSLHLKDGHFLEGSWDHAFYTRQWNTPPELQVIVMPPTTNDPGGAGEFAVAPSMAATACAYARATGTLPTSFPVNHDRADLGFTPSPTSPPIPQSPTDGLSKAF